VAAAMSTRRLAWAVVALYVALSVAALALAPDDREELDPVFMLALLAFAVIGALLLAHRPRHPIGWLFAAMAVWWALGSFALAYADRALADGLPGARLAAWVSGSAVSLYLVTFALLLFPDGRPLSPRWRLVVRAGAAWLVLLVVGYALVPGPSDAVPEVANPLGLVAAEPVLRHLDAFEAVGGGLLGLAAPVSIVVRWRRARGVERQQLKWLALAVGAVGALVVAAAVLAPLGVADDEGFTRLASVVFGVALTGVPVSICIAILRHRLFDIDLVIRRTLVYAVLTAALGATYLATVLVLGLALGGSDVAVAGATLAVAALFRPARARVQAVVDRRFYRARYDAARKVEAFTLRLRDEVELDAVAADLRAAVRETLQPAHLSLWVRP